jgi:hypothetical protein
MKKEKIIRWTIFAICLITLSVGVVFFFTEYVVPAIVCLTTAAIAAILAVAPYPFIKKDGDNNEYSKS